MFKNRRQMQGESLLERQKDKQDKTLIAPATNGGDMLGGPRSAPPMRTKVKRVKSLWRFPHPVPKCLIYVSLLFAVKADGPACSL